jgi:hypothetical protein
MSSRGRDQVKWQPTTVRAIMNAPEFELGVLHVRMGKAFNWKVGGGLAGKAWDYERGRIFGHLAPRNMPLKIDGKLNPKALALFEGCYRRGDWL